MPELPLPLEEEEPHDLASILRRVSLPLFLFSTVLLAALSLSTVFLLPDMTSVDVSGQVRSVDQMKQYRSQLTTQIRDLEKQRETSALTVHDSHYDQLMVARQDAPTLAAVRTLLDEAARKVAAVPDAVHVSALEEDAARKTVVVTGDVRFVDSRSMTVLSAFIEQLRKTPGIASVTDPSYAREDDPKTGPHSPFSITLTFS